MDLGAYRAETGRWPEGHDFDPGTDRQRNKIVESIVVNEGTIVFTFSDSSGALGGKRLAIRPGVRDDMPTVPVLWICGYARATQHYTVRGDNATDVPVEMLPVACRS